MIASRLRIGALFLVVALAAALCGCNGDPSPTAPAPTAQATDGLQPPGPQGEVVPPRVPATPLLPTSGGSRGTSGPRREQ